MNNITEAGSNNFKNIEKRLTDIKDVLQGKTSRVFFNLCKVNIELAQVQEDLKQGNLNSNELSQLSKQAETISDALKTKTEQPWLSIADRISAFVNYLFVDKNKAGVETTFKSSRELTPEILDKVKAEIKKMNRDAENIDQSTGAKNTTFLQKVSSVISGISDQVNWNQVLNDEIKNTFNLNEEIHISDKINNIFTSSKSNGDKLEILNNLRKGLEGLSQEIATYPDEVKKRVIEGFFKTIRLHKDFVKTGTSLSKKPPFNAEKVTAEKIKTLASDYTKNAHFTIFTDRLKNTYTEKSIEDLKKSNVGKYFLDEKVSAENKQLVSDALSLLYTQDQEEKTVNGMNRLLAFDKDNIIDTLVYNAASGKTGEFLFQKIVGSVEKSTTLDNKSQIYQLFLKNDISHTDKFKIFLALMNLAKTNQRIEIDKLERVNSVLSTGRFNNIDNPKTKQLQLLINAINEIAK